MAFIDRILQEPTYGWQHEDGTLVKPSLKQLYSEAFRNMNVFRDKKNWITLLAWLMVVCLIPFFIIFIIKYITWKLALLAVFYAMIIMGTHGTVWFHRYCTHNAYKFSSAFWRIFTQNLVLRTFPEETYAISHHVHHVKSDVPGDPYNPQAGLMYCMLSDVNHQSINKNLDEKDYHKVAHFLKNSGVQINNYDQYKKWGSVSSPSYIIGLWLLNWACWYGIFFLIGGHGVATACFTGAMFWFVLVRAFNYTGHGKGKVMHKDGIDYDRSNLSINQNRPGLFAGEWHNNHHLYPGSARAGFLPYQIDLAWIYIYCFFKIGAVKSYHDSKNDFMKKYREGSLERVIN